MRMACQMGELFLWVFKLEETVLLEFKDGECQKDEPDDKSDPTDCFSYNVDKGKQEDRDKCPNDR